MTIVTNGGPTADHDEAPQRSADTRIERASELIGRLVLTLDEATAPGELKDILVDSRRSGLIGFTLRGQGLLSSPSRGTVPMESVESVGRDAIMIKSEEVLLKGSDAAPLRGADEADVIGREAVTSAGVSLGTISDVMLEIEHGDARVVGYEVAGGDGQKQMIAVPEPVAISGDALVLPDDADQRATSTLTAFESSLERARA